MNNALIKILIVDDEPLARKRIRTLLANYENVEIVAECANGLEAIAAIEKNTPDLMFLDMQMPEMDGLSVINSRAINFMPLVIFVTAYDNYGLFAFDSDAVDYLLKPFDQRRFEKAFEKAQARLKVNKKQDLPFDLAEVVRQISLRAKYRKHITIRQDGRVFLVKTEEIEWIEAERNYVRLYAGKVSYPRREAIGNIEAQLDPDKFRRIHRSAIVNISFIRELRSVTGGDYQIILRNGQELVLSRTYQKNLPEFFG
jgi:two-component system, LytTR family, response regulator